MTPYMTSAVPIGRGMRWRPKTWRPPPTGGGWPGHARAMAERENSAQCGTYSGAHEDTPGHGDLQWPHDRLGRVHPGPGWPGGSLRWVH
jgi:hypothetical protein